MAKISIQQKPTFAVDVEIPRIGDKSVKVPFTFLFLDRAQMADFQDSELTNAKSMTDYLKQEDRTVRGLADSAEAFEVGQLKQIVQGWGFDDEFNDDNIKALVRSSAAVTSAIFNAYKSAYEKAREGN